MTPFRSLRTVGLALVVVGACLLAVSACANTATPAASPPLPPAAGSAAPPPPLPTNAPALERDYVAAVSRVLPSVVQISTDRGLGSGIVFDTAGDIVTNDHVVGDATHFQVRLPASPTPLSASLVGAYPPDDLAVIKLDQRPPTALAPAAFGNSAQLRIGDIVLALGSPLGLSGSVTNGIVSATGRTVTEPQSPDSPGATLPDIVQTSAAINPGNSGGALVNLSAQVIGIPTLAALDPQTGGGSAPGIGFAIPSNIVTDITHQIITNGHVVNSHRAQLAVAVVTVLNLAGQPAGAGIEAVAPAGPAAAAGISPGSIITALNGQPVPSASALTTQLAGMQPGQHVPVVLTNPGPGGGSRTVTVTLGELPGS
jgi:S1-C subfamily serine protease